LLWSVRTDGERDVSATRATCRVRSSS